MTYGMLHITYGKCFSVKHHIMPDFMLALAWRMTLCKMGTLLKCAILKSGGVWGPMLGYSWALAFGLYNPRILRSD